MGDVIGMHLLRHGCMGNIAYLRLESGNGAVESICSKLCSYRIANASATRDVRVGACFVRGAGVVHAWGFDEDFQIDFAQEFRHTKKSRSEVLGRLDHSILRFSAEYRQGSCSSEVVQQMAIELAVLDPQKEILAASKWCKQFGSQFICPVPKEGQLARHGKACSGGICDLLGKLFRSCIASGISGTMSV